MVPTTMESPNLIGQEAQQTQTHNPKGLRHFEDPKKGKAPIRYDTKFMQSLNTTELMQQFEKEREPNAL